MAQCAKCMRSKAWLAARQFFSRTLRSQKHFHILKWAQNVGTGGIMIISHVTPCTVRTLSLKCLSCKRLRKHVRLSPGYQRALKHDMRHRTRLHIHKHVGRSTVSNRGICVYKPLSIHDTVFAVTVQRNIRACTNGSRLVVTQYREYRYVAQYVNLVPYDSIKAKGGYHTRTTSSMTYTA